jgi:hypothetical protein
LTSLQNRAQLLLDAAKDPVKQAAHIELCKRDIAYWFNNFCYTFDPRQDPAVMPFNLYEVQEWFAEVLLGKMEKQEDFGLEKSRDVGASWEIALTFEYCWHFRDGWNFHIGSRKEEFVDKKGDISTLFEKIRFNLSYMPFWMMPKGFQDDKHNLFMRLINPQNGNTITGESANANFARGGRYRAVLFDEFPVWDQAEAAWTSASQSTKCRIPIGTPNGKHNKHGRLMTDPGNKRIIWPGRRAMELKKGLT